VTTAEVRVAELAALGDEPRVSTRPAPLANPGEEVVDVLAVALNPVDIAIASGRFYGGHPPLPYVPGHEAVVAFADGSRAFHWGAGRGIASDGLLAERVTVERPTCVDLPDEIDPALAVAMGTAGLAGWMSVTWRADVRSDDVVVVLGATGAVGRVAVWAARERGARVVAVGRLAERLATVGADAVVVNGEALGERVLHAAGAEPTVVIDSVWGDALVEMLGVVARRARIVQLGASAGPEVAMPSAPLRGKQLDILGYSNFGLDRDRFVANYRTLVDACVHGGPVLPIERYPLDEITSAWQRARAGEAKIVVEPSATVRA